MRASASAAAPVLPLAGVRVIDFSRIIAGPLCAQYLADLGADVIKVERAGLGDEARQYSFPAMWSGTSAMYLSFNRGKRSVALDLDDARDRDAAGELVATADVLIENFRPGVMARLGLGYETLAERHPELVYCSISGFGDEGPLAQAGANDLVAQASCGLMSLNAQEGGRPEKVAPAVVDLYTGVNAALAIVAALRQRESTGRGTRVSTSLFECGISMLSYFATSQFAPDQDEAEQDLGASITVPNQSFKASDGWMVLACSNEPMWQRLCHAIGREKLAADPRFATNLDRTHNKPALVAILDDVFAGDTRAGWAVRLEAAKVSSSAVLTVAEVLAHPQAESLGMVVPIAHAQIEGFCMLRTPFRFQDQALVAQAAPPRLNQHRDEVLASAPNRSPTR